ncbi:MAG: hypothetical protein EXS09_09775 [Gemmataceae bacterium]|nr:hypothetical protein [Gemmataceae bacterium]
MSGIRRWLPGAVLLVGFSVSFAQTPGGAPAIVAALPGGTLVGSTGAYSAAVGAIADPVMPLKTAAVAGPIVANSISASETPPPLAPGPHGLPGDAPVNALIPNWTTVGSNGLQGNNCCGPVGSDGPIGQEVYVRYGVTYAQGDSLLARNLKRGQTAQIGARTQLFNTEGDAAWAIDAHVAYAFNRGNGANIITLETEPVSIHSLHRTSVGLGLGRDWFLFQPGFILDSWDANFRLGADLGSRWGAGHVNFDTPFEIGGYRRRYDVFAQAFGGLTATMEIPMGGWTWLIGGRAEADYMWSDLIPRDASFYQYSFMGMLGVRY